MTQSEIDAYEDYLIWLGSLTDDEIEELLRLRPKPGSAMLAAYKAEREQ